VVDRIEIGNDYDARPYPVQQSYPVRFGLQIPPQHDKTPFFRGNGSWSSLHRSERHLVVIDDGGERERRERVGVGVSKHVDPLTDDIKPEYWVVNNTRHGCVVQLKKWIVQEFHAQKSGFACQDGRHDAFSRGKTTILFPNSSRIKHPTPHGEGKSLEIRKRAHTCVQLPFQSDIYEL